MKTTAFKLKFFILIFNIILSTSVYAQKEGNIWPVYNYTYRFDNDFIKHFVAGRMAFNFNEMDINGYPKLITPDEWLITGEENIFPSRVSHTAISDKNGKFLFSTNLMHEINKFSPISGYFALFDRNRKMIENSDYLKSNKCGYNNQLIIPIPCNNELYYIFHTSNSDDICYLSNSYNLEEYRSYLRKVNGAIYYSIVDMSQGNAKVLKKNQLLDSVFTHVLTAIPHANGRDYWLITQPAFKDSILAYKISPYGISPPVVSKLESKIDYFYHYFYQPLPFNDYEIPCEHHYYFHFSYIFFVNSSAGKDKLITRADRGKILLIDFDNSNGKASLLTELNSEIDTINSWNGYSKIATADFSPSGNMLYTIEWKFNQDNSKLVSHLFQYKIDINDKSLIKESKTLIKVFNGFDCSTISRFNNSIQSAPDNKVYLQTRDDKGLVFAIHQPAKKGISCDLRLVPFDKYRLFGLFPFMPPYLWFQPAIQTDVKKKNKVFCENQVLCAGDSVYFTYTGGTTSPPPTNTLIWYIFNPDSDLVYKKTTINNHSLDFKANKAGKYEILIINEFNDSIRHSFYVTPIPEPFLPEVIHSVTPDFYLDAGPADNYLWSTGQEEQIIHISKTGLYTVTKDVNGCNITETVEIGNMNHLYVPNAFSPEGFNPLFKAYGNDIISFSMTIYNRWGQKLFETKDINKGWDGKINNLIQPAGAYVYKISFTSKYQIETKTLNGIFYLIK